MPRKKKTTGLLPSGNYRRKVYVGERSDGSKRYESFSGPDAAAVKAEAAAFRARVLQLRREGVAVDDITREGEAAHPKDTVRRYLDLYLDTCRAIGLSPSTLLSYKRIIGRAYRPLLDIPASNITVPMIQRYANERAETASGKTIRCELSLLGCALRQARPDLDMRSIHIPRQTRQEISIPTTDQVRRMITAAKETDLFIPLLLAALMGLRRSEICGLKWADVDIRSRQLHIHSAVVRGEAGAYQTKQPKTSAGDRVLAIPKPVADALANARNLDPRVTKLTPDAITRRFERLLDKLKMRFRFHDLRHYHASVMISVGAPDKYITADMGHATMDMVHRVYGHVMQDRQIQIHEQMERQAEQMQI